MISCVDWDPRAERLAVAYGPAHPSAGNVALYSTTCQPVITASYMGLISQGGKEGGGPVRDVAFHQHYGPGALLAVRGGGDKIDTIPMLFAD